MLLKNGDWLVLAASESAGCAPTGMDSKENEGTSGLNEGSFAGSGAAGRDTGACSGSDD